MFVIKNYVTTGGTVACALAIGYLMQNGSPAQPNGTQTVVNATAMTDQASIIAGLEDIVLTSSTPATDATQTRKSLQPNRSAPSEPMDCKLSARARAVPGAAAALTVRAPCHPNHRVEVLHSGLTVTQMTDEKGRMELTLPALSEYAIFLISVDDQNGTVATTHVPDLNQYNRIALQWTGKTDLQIHALEFGASYGGAGHVSSDPNAQGAGNVVTLGHSGLESARNVEVYSFPAAQVSQSGSIALTVEAEVTDANCDRDLSVQSFELRSDRRLTSREMTLNLPNCTQTGEFLVLNNLIEDLTIAAN
ncbi:hypothetical protein RUESEDTHA_01367 [Ruegeria sp. THAF57]|uniref:hypothetical protein n=1 Tax=Ruegeria sp. THAF57 TaxID=2744555 RepID=UPI0015DE7E22|nr:hypothetical protein [Ruegeria sp. THAF57]CAD0184485.1 hypothetical protein RUESEDTHA_01367 [Ruegeria sp. THAF57]